MLRAVSTIYIESHALELFSLTRRDVFKLFRSRAPRATRAAPPAGPAPPARAAHSHTVLSAAASPAPADGPAGGAGAPAAPPPPAPPPPPRRAWTVAAALAFTVSLGGVYFYRKLSDDTRNIVVTPAGAGAGAGAGAAEGRPEGEPDPLQGAAFPPHVDFLLVGGGTAAFAAMRALRAVRPDARVLLVSEERALPYMRPPLSKELWREPGLAQRARDPDALTFRQWNGKRRSVAYEPASFYTPVDALAAEGAGGGAAVARGWRVARLHVARHEAELHAPGRAPVAVRYGRCLVATGVRARRVPALRRAAAAGRSLPLRSLDDVARLAERLDSPHVRRVAVVGGGFLATELSAALADRLSPAGKEVVLVVAERAPLAGVLPLYLARDAARRLRAAGVTVLADVEVRASEMAEGRVALQLARTDGAEAVEAALAVDLVVECAGCEPDDALAAASGLETHPELGGLVVTAELQARADVYAAGDAACFYDVVLGRRRVEHHDHAVVSGRLAGENMAGVAPPRPYAHQSMFWSDLGPQLGYEAIGIIDSRLPTVGVFSADAVTEAAGTQRAADAPAPAVAGAEARRGALEAGAEGAGGAEARRYERGVVFYVRGQRVVGVLLWNLFNRMHVARQVLAQGEFEDLFEVAKLFAPHEED